jgi:threonine/homoserine/homoserine lactone efflux protein
MRYLPNLGVLAAVWAAVVISPGPDFVATIHAATSRSRHAGLAVVAGIAIGTAIWATGALAGLALLLARASWLLDVVRVGGAVLLCWLGLRAIRHAGKPVAPDGAAAPSRPLRTGLLTDLANPKAALFWSSLFAALQPAHPPAWVQVASVVVVVAIAAAWYGLVAVAFSLAPVARVYRRGKRWLDYLTGGVFLALASRLATD